ncbi:MAG: DUF5611 family protein [Thermoplasmata archaeon]
MQRYPVRTSHRGNLDLTSLTRCMESLFEGVSSDGKTITGHFGAIASIKVWSEGRELAVDVRTDPKVAVEVAQATVQRYNRFLEETTGYSAKERARRLRKSATGAAPGA